MFSYRFCAAFVLFVYATLEVHSAEEAEGQKLEALLEKAWTDPEVLLDLKRWPKEKSIPILIESLANATASEGDRVDAAKRALLSVPGWEVFIASYLEAIVVRSKEGAHFPELERNSLIKAKSLNPRVPAEEKKLSEIVSMLDKEREKYGSGIRAREEFFHVLKALGKVGTEQVVALIGPYLEIESERVDFGDSSIAPMEVDVASIINTMKLRGVAIPDAPYSNYDKKAWRQWWLQKRPHYQSLLPLQPTRQNPQIPSVETPAPLVPTINTSVPTDRAKEAAARNPNVSIPTISIVHRRTKWLVVLLVTALLGWSIWTITKHYR